MSRNSQIVQLEDLGDDLAEDEWINYDQEQQNICKNTEAEFLCHEWENDIQETRMEDKNEYICKICCSGKFNTSISAQSLPPGNNLVQETILDKMNKRVTLNCRLIPFSSL